MLPDHDFPACQVTCYKKCHKVTNHCKLIADDAVVFTPYYQCFLFYLFKKKSKHLFEKEIKKMESKVWIVHTNMTQNMDWKQYEARKWNFFAQDKWILTVVHIWVGTTHPMDFSSTLFSFLCKLISLLSPFYIPNE